MALLAADLARQLARARLLARVVKADVVERVGLKEQMVLAEDGGPLEGRAVQLLASRAAVEGEAVSCISWDGALAGMKGVTHWQYLAWSGFDSEKPQRTAPQKQAAVCLVYSPDSRPSASA